MATPGGSPSPTEERTFPGATVMVLGAARCGTSSIHELFRLHSAACVSQPKEPFFFEAEYQRGLDWYRRTYFPHWNGQGVVVEARPAHLLLPYVAPRIKATFPDARFIISLREPAERAFSHWALNHTLGLEQRPFAVAVAQAIERPCAGNDWEVRFAEQRWCAHVHPRMRRITCDWYLEAGFYATHLRRFFALFPRERFFILTIEDLRDSSSDIARRLLEFAGLDPALGPGSVPMLNGAARVGSRLLHRIDVALGLPRLVPPGWRRKLRGWTSMLQPRLEAPAETMAALREVYAPHDRDLCDLLGWSRCPWDHS
jgi:hypothetical protein